MTILHPACMCASEARPRLHLLDCKFTVAHHCYLRNVVVLSMPVLLSMCWPLKRSSGPEADARPTPRTIICAQVACLLHTSADMQSTRC